MIKHFAPWGSYTTTCGLAIFPKGYRDFTTDERKQTTCPNCRAKFTDSEEE